MSAYVPAVTTRSPACNPFLITTRSRSFSPSSTARGFEPRVVELGEKLRGRVVVKNGLKAGERVVMAGTYALKARLLKSQIGDSH